MTDKKLTDNEIVKALQCCADRDTNCRGCCFWKESDCVVAKSKSALDLINRLQADCENYKQVAEYQQSVTMDRGFEIKRLKEKIESLQAENERLKQIIEDKGGLILMELAKAEAHREFADRLLNQFDIGVYNSAYIRNKIYNLLKKMVGEDKSAHIDKQN